MKRTITTFCALASAAFACVVGGCTLKPADEPGGNADQVTAGAPLYLANCAKCHGPLGEGTSRGPTVVGKSAFPLNAPPGSARKTQFRTAQDVLEFVRENMPKDKPGSLRDDEYAAILAFALKANGFDLHHERVNEDNAAAIRLH